MNVIKFSFTGHTINHDNKVSDGYTIIRILVKQFIGVVDIIICEAN